MSLEVLYAYYPVQLQFTHRLLGGIPKDPAVIRKWLEVALQDTSRVDVLLAQTLREMGLSELPAPPAPGAPEKGEPEAHDLVIEAISKVAWTGFKRDETGLFIEGRQVKAMLKEAASVLSKTLGVFGLKAKLAEQVYVVEDKIHLWQVGQNGGASGGIQAPDGTLEGPVHLKDRYGNPFSALKRTDYVDQPRLRFTLRGLNQPLPAGPKKTTTWEAILPALFSLGGQLGLGASRSQGHGQFQLQEPRAWQTQMAAWETIPGEEKSA